MSHISQKELAELKAMAERKGMNHVREEALTGEEFRMTLADILPHPGPFCSFCYGSPCFCVEETSVMPR